MKSKSIHTLLCIAAAASLLTACSTADDTTAEQTAQATAVSFSGNASVEGATEATTRGYFNDATVGNSLTAYTWETGDVIKAAVWDASAKKFLASGTDYSWDATTTPSADGSSASVTWEQDLTDFDKTTSYKQLLVSVPDATKAVVTSKETEFSITYTIPTDITGAKANSMDHLKPYSFIYAEQDGFTGGTSTSDLQFNYIPALFRFAIANGNAANVSIKSVKMECNESIFYSEQFYTLDAYEHPASYYYMDTGKTLYPSISVSLADATDIEPGKYARIYTATLPTHKKFSNYNFTFTITTSDGKTYTSNVISGKTLADEWTNNVVSGVDTATDLFREGKSYTFKLWFDNQKGLSFVSSSAIKGWGDDTDL